LYPRIRLKPGREKSVLFRHPWIFSRALEDVPGDIENGSLVSVVSSDGKVLGTGYYNGYSQIAIRLLAFHESVIDEVFFKGAFKQAIEFRKQFINSDDTNAYRIVFGESDGLPGLVVDRYNDFLVIQIHTLGMDKLRPQLLEALKSVLPSQGIYERSDLEVRKKEDLRTFPKGVLSGQQPPDHLEICEHGIKFFVDIKNGQKTGFFLDQRENRQAIIPFTKGKNVLNLCCYSGGFSVAALTGGAAHTTNVDISRPVLDLARSNFELNGFDPSLHRFISRDAFEYLDECIGSGEKFDFAVVDPPAFVKNRESLAHGTNAYIKLYEKVMKVLGRESILASSSCSSHVTPELYRMILFKAALEAKKDLVILEQRIQPPDHPLRVNFPEGEYLKFAISRVNPY